MTWSTARSGDGGYGIRRAAVLAAAILLAACTPGPVSGGSAGGGTVIYGATSDAANLDPLLASDGSSMSVWELIFEPLVVPDPKTGAPSPWLADSWDQSDGGLTYTFHLHPGIRWSDGQPFSADDIAFTFEKVMDPKTRTPDRSRLEDVSSYRALGPLTFAVHLKRPDCTFLSEGAQIPIVPKHLLASSKDINNDRFGTSAPVGTGPFMFKEWSRDDHLTLVANPSYWRGRPKIDEWVRKVVKDQNVNVAQLKTGEIDYGQVSPGSIASLQKDPHLNVQLVPGGTQVQIAYDLADPLFADVRVREALTEALDRQEIMKTVLFGFGRVVDSPIVPSSWAYDPNVPRAPYDVAAAQRLLQEAGWRPDASGILHKDGVPLSFTIITRTGAKAIEAIPTIAQAMWKKIGVDARVQLLSVSAFNDRFRRTHSFQAAVYSTVAGVDPDLTATWASSEYPKGGNYVKFADPTVDRLLAAARTLPGCDQAKRKALYAQVQQTIANDHPWTFLYNNQVPVAVNDRVRNVEASPWRGSIPYIGWSAQKWTVSK